MQIAMPPMRRIPLLLPMVAALSDFVWKGKYNPLSDPAITNLCRVVKVLTVTLLVGMVPVLALIWQHR